MARSCSAVSVSKFEPAPSCCSCLLISKVLLRKIPRLARRFHACLSLLQRVCGVPNLDAEIFLLLHDVHLCTAQFQLGSELICSRHCRLRSGICTCISAR